MKIIDYFPRLESLSNYHALFLDVDVSYRVQQPLHICQQKNRPLNKTHVQLSTESVCCFWSWGCFREYTSGPVLWGASAWPCRCSRFKSWQGPVLKTHPQWLTTADSLALKRCLMDKGLISTRAFMFLVVLTIFLNADEYIFVSLFNVELSQFAHF